MRIDKRRSVEVFGVSIRVMELASACRTAEVVAGWLHVSVEHDDGRGPSRTLETSNLLADEALTDILAYFL